MQREHEELKAALEPELKAQMAALTVKVGTQSYVRATTKHRAPRATSPYKNKSKTADLRSQAQKRNEVRGY